MNGADVRVNGNGLSSNMAEGEVDADILAAIAASKQDHHADEEEDPAVLAAIEASKQETGAEDGSAKVVEEKEPKKESKGPILMFSTLGRSTEPYDEDDTFDSHVTEEEPAEDEEEAAGKEDDVVDDDADVAEPGDLDPDDAELPAADLDNGDDSNNLGAGGKKKK